MTIQLTSQLTSQLPPPVVDVATLRAEGVSFRHRRRGPWVLRDVSLEVRSDEVVGLRGPSGSGKSTLARVLAGLALPQAGSVHLAGRGDRPRASHPVQMVMQHAVLAMNPRWRVRDVLDEPLADVDGEATLDGLVDPAWLDRYPHEVSGGQLQRINLARALLADPEFLIADEITASLDAITQARLWRDLTARTSEGGIGLLVISHDDALLNRLCDRVLDLRDLTPHPVERPLSAR